MYVCIVCVYVSTFIAAMEASDVSKHTHTHTHTHTHAHTHTHTHACLYTYLYSVDCGEDSMLVEDSTERQIELR